MSLVKFASFAVQEAWMAPGLDAPRQVVAHRHEFDYVPRPGYLYVRSRAISSRCNDNYDEFPAEEIRLAYRSFIGKPVFVNHHNEDHRRARGVIIDAALHDDVNPDGSDDVWAEVLMEVDAVRFPRLAKAILAGEVDRTSMGTDVAYSKCSFCGNKARNPMEYCAHIPRLKGQRIRRITAGGEPQDILVREICYGLGFFENSLLVEDPADPTAYFLGVDDHSGLALTAARTAVHGEDLVPQDWVLFRINSHRARDGLERYLQIKPTVLVSVGAEPLYAVSPEDWARIESHGGNTLKGIKHVKKRPDLTDYMRPIGAKMRTPQWDEEDETAHPREQAGRFTEGQDENDGSEADGEAPEGKPRIEGKTEWTKGVGSKDDPVETDDVTEAADALTQGLYVELIHAPKVCVFLDKLAEQIRAVETATGEKAPVINLCNVTVQDTNLFCIESKGIPRVEMPQLKVQSVPEGSRAAQEIQPNENGEYDLQPLFAKRLEEMGVKVKPGKRLASHLKATQNELDTKKVAGISKAVREGTMTGDEAIFVSNDDYIVDGHHRWAGAVAADWDDADPTDIEVETNDVDMDIISLLAEANRFAEEYGIPQMAVGASKRRPCFGCGDDMTRTASKKAAVDLRHMEQVVTDHLGHYNGNVTWFLQHRMDTATAEQVANVILDRDAQGARKMVGGEVWVKDQAEWMPKMLAACQAMLDEIRGGTTTTAVMRANDQMACDLPGCTKVVKRDSDAYNYVWEVSGGYDETWDFCSREHQASFERMFPEWREIGRAEMRAKSRERKVLTTEGGFHDERYRRIMADVPDETFEPCAVCGSPVAFMEWGEGPGLWMDKDGQYACSVTALQEQGWEEWEIQSSEAYHHPEGKGPHTAAAAEDDKIPAPPEVDTLRDETCPVCGEKDSYDGNQCSVCQFIKPPEMFNDPDLDAAKQQDLREDGETAQGDPNAAPPEQQEQTDDSPTFTPPAGSQTVEPEEPEQIAETDAPDGATPEQPAEDSEEDAPEDADEAEDEDDEEGSGKPDFLKKKKKKDKKKPGQQVAGRLEHGEGVDVAMRPALAALYEQQIRVEALDAKIEALARLAGVDLSAIDQKAQTRLATLRKKADEANPAQPIPEPAPEAPYTTTQEEIAPITPSSPEGGSLPDDPTEPGAASVTDVSPDATTSLADTGTVLDEPLDLNEQDVTAPVEGTTEQRPLEETKIETDIVAETGDNSSVHFPITPAFSAQPTTGSRIYASLRLARMRLVAGIAEGDDLMLGETIAASPDMTDEMIEGEIETLSKVIEANRRNAKTERPRGLVPRQAAGSGQSVASMAEVPSMESLARDAMRVQDDEVLFEG